MSAKPERIRLWMAAAILFLVLPWVTSCGVNRELTGRWQLAATDNMAFAPGMIFEFANDRTLTILQSQAQLPDEQSVFFQAGSQTSALSYTAGTGGNLSIFLKTPGSSAVTFKMTYELSGDVLAITDGDGLTLYFQRLADPAN